MTNGLLAAVLCAGQAIETGRALDATKAELEGATAWTFVLHPTAALETPGLYAVSADLSVLYLFGSETLRQISLADFKELRAFDLKKEAGPLWLSKEGLAVKNWHLTDLGTDKGEIWILDPDTLSVRWKHPYPGGATIGSPGSSVAFHAARGVTGVVDRIGMMDLKTGKLAKTPALWDMGKRHDRKDRRVLQEFPPARSFLSDDGRTLVVHHGHLHRFRVTGMSVSYESIGPMIWDSPHVVVSSDGGHAMVRGRYPVVEGKPMPEPAALVFDVGNLQKAPVRLPDVAPLAVDPARKKLYAWAEGTGVVQFTLGGRREAEYRISLAHPPSSARVSADGFSLLLLPELPHHQTARLDFAK